MQLKGEIHDTLDAAYGIDATAYDIDFNGLLEEGCIIFPFCLN